ncbi:MAG TPA: DUF4384 domain-containing protein [Blastocatellia bacterium]|nr:DUF4384 domain-containing protein [Blastocatellia bacterium]
MKLTSISIAICLFILSIGLVHAAAQTPRARDLFNDFDSSPDRQRPPSKRRGRPGTKIQMELMRGDGPLKLASSNTPIFNDDRIAFRLAVNYEGYMTVTNIGTSGQVNLLFAGHVSPTESLRIPATGWIRVAGAKGEEMVNFIMSADPPQGLPQAGGTEAGADATGSGSQSVTEKQEILKELNSRAINRGRDLVAQSEATDMYVVAPSPQALSAPHGFSVKLNHK